MKQYVSLDIHSITVTLDTIIINARPDVVFHLGDILYIGNNTLSLKVVELFYEEYKGNDYILLTMNNFDNTKTAEELYKYFAYKSYYLEK